MSMKNSSDTIGNRTRDLPACSSVPQPNCTAGCLPTSHSTKLKSPGRYLDKPQAIEPWYRQTAVSVEMPLFLRRFISGFRSSGTLRSARLLHDDVSTTNRCLIFQRLTFWCRNYFFLILSHPVYKMWIIQEPNTLELWNKMHSEEEKKNGEYIPCLKYSVPIFVE